MAARAGLSSDDIRRLLGSVKPPFVAEGVSRRDGPGSDRSFHATHDGGDGWVIRRPDLDEVTVGGRTTLVRDGEPEEFEPGVPVHVNGDVKVGLDGRRMADLARGSFQDLGTSTVAGRSCLRVRAEGLKGDDPVAIFEIDVDRETGVILRIARDDLIGFEVTFLRVGAPPGPLRPAHA